MKPHRIQKHLLLYSALIVSLGWTITIALVSVINTTSYYDIAEKLALNEAQVSVKKDLAYRTWVSSHGGVYVPTTEKTPPNPYLSNIDNRDVSIVGKSFTLMNPAYTLSQMMKDYTDLYGIQAKITSTNLLNPNNAPDNWELEALKQIEKTQQPFYEISHITGKGDYLRYMNPLVTAQSCLKCHAHQGYQVGDIRGGVAVSVPLKEHYNLAFTQSGYLILSLFIIWLLGQWLIYWGYNKLKIDTEKRIEMYEQYLYSLVDIIEQRDSYTAGHTRRVALYSIMIAKKMGYNETQMETLYRAAMLHDIGKISTPDAILLKPGKLSELEFSLIQQHVSSSYEILSSLETFKELAEIVRHHHERYDGKGYPQGLSGDQIPVIAYILALADAFDAMTTSRIYKGRRAVTEALEEVRENSGKQFHPEVAKAAQEALKEVVIDPSIQQKPKTPLEEARFSYFYKDQLTQTYNLDYLDFILARKSDETQHYHCAYGVYLHNTSGFNKEHGWNRGNKLIQEFAQELSQKFPSSLIFRLFGDDFIVLNQEHLEFPAPESFKSLSNTVVNLSYRHIDLHGKELSAEELEGLL